MPIITFIISCLNQIKIKDYLFFASQDHHYHQTPLFWIAKEQYCNETCIDYE